MWPADKGGAAVKYEKMPTREYFTEDDYFKIDPEMHIVGNREGCGCGGRLLPAYTALL